MVFHPHLLKIVQLNISDARNSLVLLGYFAIGARGEIFLKRKRKGYNITYDNADYVMFGKSPIICNCKPNKPMFHYLVADKFIYAQLLIITTPSKNND